MKRRYAAVMALLCAGVLALGGCQKKTQPENTQKITKYEDLEGKTLAMFSVPLSEEKLIVVLEKLSGLRFGKVSYVNTAMDAVALIQAGKAEAALVPEMTADYITARNEDLTYMPRDTAMMECFMVLKASNTALRDEINAAIKELEENGTYDTLKEKYLSKENRKEDPKEEQAEPVSGEETIRVGISGEIPPMDYTEADGTPAGFNVAYLSEIGKIIGKNIEFVSMTGEAKFAALESDRIDVFFWHTTLGVVPDTAISTDIYLREPGGYLIKK